MRLLMLLAIRFYRRWLSPYKGFRCAHAAWTGRASCSDFALSAAGRFGPLRALTLIDRRLERCGETYQRYRPLAQRGACDFNCDRKCDCRIKGCGYDVDTKRGPADVNYRER